jgi:hsp70-interacting protein
MSCLLEEVVCQASGRSEKEEFLTFLLSHLSTLINTFSMSSTASPGSGPNWLGLLKWSLSHSDGTSPSPVQAMSTEDKQWLETVMKECVKDEGQRLCEILKEFMEMIDNGTVHRTEQEEKIFELLEETQMMVDQIDMANVFVKFGGIKVLKILLSSQTSDGIRCLSCVLIGELAQNNPTVQDQMFQNGVIDELCLISLTNSVSSKLCVKALYGLSCVIRGHRNSELRFFHELNGPIFLHRMLQRHDSSCTGKILFLLGALVSSDSTTFDMVTTYGDLLFEECYPFLQLKTHELECQATLQFLSSLTHSGHARRYLDRHQARILSVLEEKYQMIQVEKKESTEEDYTTELGLISEVMEAIKRGISDLHEQEEEAGSSRSQEQQLRLCG